MGVDRANGAEVGPSVTSAVAGRGDLPWLKKLIKGPPRSSCQYPFVYDSILDGVPVNGGALRACIGAGLGNEATKKGMSLKILTFLHEEMKLPLDAELAGTCSQDLVSCQR